MVSASTGARAGNNRSERSARAIVPIVMQLVGPRRVIDLGCGRGAWLSIFSEQGAEEVVGVDGPWTRLDRLQIPASQFIAFDLRRPFRPAGQFDLALSLEVGEHLPEDAADALVDSLAGAAPVVLFSAAVPFQGGFHHLNEQWPEYWIERFAARGYVFVDVLRRRIWQNPDVAYWYAQNLLLFVRRGDLEKYPALVRALEDGAPLPAAVVHPRLYLHMADPQQWDLRKTLSVLRVASVTALRRRWDRLTSAAPRSALKRESR